MLVVGCGRLGFEYVSAGANVRSPDGGGLDGSRADGSPTTDGSPATDGSDGSPTAGDGAACPDSCDADGDGYEVADGCCAGTDCDDAHPNCWDATAHGCCTDERLLFHSGFEGPLSFDMDSACVGNPTGERRPILRGTDSTGFSWESFPGDDFFWQTVTSCSSELLGADPALVGDPTSQSTGTTGYANAAVVSEPSPSGERALLLQKWRTDGFIPSSLVQNVWTPPASMVGVGRAVYVSYWIKFQSNLVESQSHDEFFGFPALSDWRAFWELKYQGCGWGQNGYRMVLIINRNGGDYMRWNLRSDDGGYPNTSRIVADSTAMSPPGDQWFFLEIYVYTHPTAGRVWIGVNGRTLADESMMTWPDREIAGTPCATGWQMRPMQLSSSAYNDESSTTPPFGRPGFQHFQYYDEVRFHSDLPSGHCAIDGSCPVFEGF